MWAILSDIWFVLLTVITLVTAITASGHAILKRRNSRAVIAWVGLIWLAPLLGSIAYFTLGVNRIRRRGRLIGMDIAAQRERVQNEFRLSEEEREEAAHRHPKYYRLANLVGRVTDRDLLPGNHVTPLVSGEQAYPAMLAAIDQAETSIGLCSYIFDNDRAGREFIDALGRAHRRGVAVRVLVDDVGSRYSRPTIISILHERHLPHATFLPTRTPRLFNYANLRNHRKVLVVDGRIGFTGGMNIREECRLDWNPKHPTLDLHFRIEGPVVSHLQESFATDWAFTTRERLCGNAWFPRLQRAGDVLARGVTDGPDEDLDKMLFTILGGLASAQDRITIVTPYFLPDDPVVAALNVAAMRGVDVRILLPEISNVRLVQWACSAQLWQILEHGCRVWLTPPPFDHTKLLLVDEAWTFLGSTNWDPRSLRLNFEFNVECYDEALNDSLSRLAGSKITAARELTFAEVESRSIPVRLRDGIARLLSPYL